MKILHVITTLDVGGAEMHLLSQVRGQSAAGHEVRVAYLKGAGTLADDFRAAGASWVGCVTSGPRLVVRLPRHFSWADILHSHLLKADMATALLATLCFQRRKLISGKHNDEQVLKRPLVSLVHGLVGNLPVRTIVLSDHVGRFVERHGRVKARKLTRIYYGIDRTPFETAAAAPRGEHVAARAELGADESHTVFVCVARFAPQKAHDVLLRAFRKAHAEDSTLRLWLVGGDPFGDGVEKARALSRELGLDDCVTFCGIRRDVPRLLAASDAFVMSSLWEGLGLVFLEAMATRIPVLATRVSAVPEVVVHGETGLLVEPGDADDLARGFLELARDPDARRAMGAAGAERVREVFGLDRMVQRTLDVYREVIAENA